MFCRNCGAQMKDGGQFCPKCGFRVRDKAPGDAEQEKAQKGKKGIGGVIAVAAFAVVVAAGVAVGLWMRFGGADSGMDPETAVLAQENPEAESETESQAESEAESQAEPTAAQEREESLTAPEQSENASSAQTPLETESDEKQEEYQKPTFDLEQEINQIREWYYAIQPYGAGLDVSSVIKASDGAGNMKIVVPKGTDGIEYQRDYYFMNGRLYFAFVFIENRENRFYFWNADSSEDGDILIRYIDEQGTTHDLADADAYREFADGFREDAYQYID